MKVQVAKISRAEKRANLHADTIDALEKAIVSAKRGYWGQTVERAELAAKTARAWYNIAEKL